MILVLMGPAAGRAKSQTLGSYDCHWLNISSGGTETITTESRGLFGAGYSLKHRDSAWYFTSSLTLASLKAQETCVLGRAGIVMNF